jgi:hypothetical protein
MDIKEYQQFDGSYKVPDVRLLGRSLAPPEERLHSDDALKTRNL